MHCLGSGGVAGYQNVCRHMQETPKQQDAANLLKGVSAEHLSLPIVGHVHGAQPCLACF